MKQAVYILLCASLLIACSTLNRIVTTNEDELNSMKLVQSPNTHFVRDKSSPDNSSKLQLFTTYSYQEKADTHPVVTVGFQFKNQINEAVDSVIFINLDNENIQLDSLLPVNNAGTNLPPPLLPDYELITDTAGSVMIRPMKREYVIPENLWLPIAYSRKIVYRLFLEKKEVKIELNQLERNKLIQFLKVAIKQTEERFPAIPEGQKKW